MSHMDPVSGTDIDLFIEGIIPCSLHLQRIEVKFKKKKIETATKNVRDVHFTHPYRLTC